MRVTGVALAIASAAALLPATAVAVLVPAQVVDAPPGLLSTTFGEADLAPDGTGALAYAIDDKQVWVAPVTAAGTFGTPIKLAQTPNLVPLSIRVAAGNGGRLAVVWREQTVTAIKARVRPSGSADFGAETAFSENKTNYSLPSVDMNAAGIAYAAWSVDNDVVAARLDGTTWTPIAGPLEEDGNQAAGLVNNGQGVVVGVDDQGNAAVALVEGFQNPAVESLRLRRLTGTTPGGIVRVDPATYEGGTPDINTEQLSMDVDGSGIATVAWRRQYKDPGDNNGRSRALAARVNGLSVIEVTDVDNLTFPNIGMDGGEFPKVAANDAGQWLGASYGQFDGSIRGLRGGSTIPVAIQRLDLDGDTNKNLKPNPALGDTGAGLIAYSSSDNANVFDVRARVFSPSGLEAGEPRLNDDTHGKPAVTSDGDQASASRDGDVAVGFASAIQGGASFIIGALLDQPPVPATITGPTGGIAQIQPAKDLWGALKQEVLLDGAVAATSAGEQTSFTLPSTLAPGAHTLSVKATDARGQTSMSNTLTFTIPATTGGGGGGGGGTTTADRTGPRFTSVKAPKRVRLRRRVARIVVRVTVSDPSGVRRLTARCGQAKAKRVALGKSVSGRRSGSFACRARRRGAYRIRLAATDNKGNVSRRSVSVRVR